MGSSGWAELPMNLLHSVLTRLPLPSDYVHFSLVCKSWNYLFMDKPSIQMKAPMFLAYTGKDEAWELCDTTKDKVFNLQLELPTTRFCGSSKGWLITMDENFIISLINPVKSIKGRRQKENSIIKLPALNLPEISDEKFRSRWSKNSDYFIHKATLSADPISEAKDCIVVVIYGCFKQLAFIRLDKDTTWTCINDVGNIEEVIYARNRFYALDGKERLLYFNATGRFNAKLDDIVWVKNHGVLAPRVKRSYLVESISDHKDLMMVHRYVKYVGKRRSRETCEFQVFKFDEDKRDWTEINTLGDVAIFLGYNSSTSVSPAQNFGCMPNCIYFTHDYDDVPRPKPRDNGVHNLATKLFLPIGTDPEILRHQLEMCQRSFEKESFQRSFEKESLDELANLWDPPYTQATTLIKSSKRRPIWVNMYLELNVINSNC